MFYLQTLIKELLPTRLTHQVRELYLATTIVNFAVAIVAIFEPIYLYKNGFTLQGVLLFYLGVYVAYFLALPLGAKFARRFGYEKAIFLGAPFLAAYYIFLYLVPESNWYVAAAILSFVVQKTFYWPGFHADFARFGRGEERGRELSNIMIISSLVTIAGPFIGGLIISIWGFKMLFAALSVLILASNLPLLATPEKFTPVPFSYGRAFRRLIYPENRRNFLGFAGFGEELIAMVIWPIFIFMVLGDFLSVGSVAALATLATAAILFFVGEMVDGDHEERRGILKLGSIFTAASGLLRLLVQGALGIFLVDSLARTSKNVVVVPMMAMTYDRANETSVMKTVIFFEMSLVVGKIFAIILSLAALALVPDSFAPIFIIAAAMSLLYSLVKYDPIKLQKKKA